MCWECVCVSVCVECVCRVCVCVSVCVECVCVLGVLLLMVNPEILLYPDSTEATYDISQKHTNIQTYISLQRWM